MGSKAASVVNAAEYFMGPDNIALNSLATGMESGLKINTGKSNCVLGLKFLL